MIDHEADTAAILSNGDFNVDAVFTITPAVGMTPAVELTVPGWYTEGTQSTSLLTNEIETIAPSFVCASSLLETSGHVVTNRMAVTINGAGRTVQRIEKSGVGHSTIYLKT